MDKHMRFYNLERRKDSHSGFGWQDNRKLVLTLTEFKALPRLSTFFPLVFQTGGRWDTFTGFCKSCDVEFPDEHLRGEVRTVGTGEASYRFLSLPMTFIIHAYGYCAACQRITGIDYELHEDMWMSGFASNGEWMNWPPKRTQPSLFRRLWRRVFGHQPKKPDLSVFSSESARASDNRVTRRN